MGPLRRFELGEHRVDEERRALAQGRHHLARERLAESRLGAPPGGETLAPGAEPGGREARREALEQRRDLRSDGAQPHRHERGAVGAERERDELFARRKGGRGHFVPVVILGRHPEAGDGGHARRFERLGVAHRGGRLDQGEVGAAEQAGLLAADDDARRRKRELGCELGSARVTVGGVRDPEAGGQVRAVDGGGRRRRKRPRRQGSVSGESSSRSRPASQAAGSPEIAPAARRSIAGRDSAELAIADGSAGSGTRPRS